MNKPLVKVCCISTKAEALIALDAGADLLGFVSKMPSGPGVIPLDTIGKIIAALPSETKSVLLTSKTEAKAIINQTKAASFWGIQLVDKITRTELLLLREALPNIVLIQVIHVRGLPALIEALEYVALVDMLLLDSGQPMAKNKSLGGTGQTHDWDVSRKIVKQSTLPVMLAGGLNPNNVTNA